MNITQKIPLFAVCDSEYLPFAVATFLSVLQHTKREVLLHIVHDGTLSAKQCQQVNRLFCQLTGSPVSFLHWKNEEKISTKGSGFPALVFARLLLPELFPQYDRAIYLDSDMLMERDIGELFDTPLENRAIGAVPENLWKEVFSTNAFFDPENKITYREYYQKLGLSPDHPYCNSGLLLMDMALLRKIQIGKIVSAHCNDKLRFPDQDLLNAYLKDMILPLDASWNNLFYTPDPPAQQNIHFLQKPWKNSSASAYFGHYWQFMRKTPGFYRADNVRKIAHILKDMA